VIATQYYDIYYDNNHLYGIWLYVNVGFG